MPVALLFVEGKLDAELLGAVLQGSPVVKVGGSKGDLPHQVRRAREDRIVAACLRDRDFEYSPTPAGGDSGPPPIHHSGEIAGWRWHRHEIENYLLDPAIVSACFGWPTTAYEEALVEAAQRIRHYQAARWALASLQRTLPPAIPRRHEECGKREFALPTALDEPSQRTWVLENAGAFRQQLLAVLDEAAVESLLTEQSRRLADPAIATAAGALEWCSGKDLLAALGPWLVEVQKADPQRMRRRLRDWVRDHPDQALERLPEWRGLVTALRTFPS